MKTVTYGILTVMISGLIGNALALWKNHAVVENKVSTLEKKQEKQDNDYSELRDQVNEMHWYLIRSKNVVVPPKGK